MPLSAPKQLLGCLHFGRLIRGNAQRHGHGHHSHVHHAHHHTKTVHDHGAYLLPVPGSPVRFSGVRLAPKTYLVNGRNHFWRKCKKEAKLFRPLSSNMDRFCKLPQLFSKKDPRSSAPGNCSSFRPLICRRACRQRSAAAQKPGRPAFRCAGGSARRQLRPAFPPAERCSPSGWNKDD